MSREHPIEIFMPPNMLKAKIGGRIAGIDMAAVRRAEAAMMALQTEFSQWVETDVAALIAACDTYNASATAGTRDQLFRAGHDLRGQALTFGYPIVARVADSLCKLLDTAVNPVSKPLIDAHVSAIRAIVKQAITGDGDTLANTLAGELDARVNDYLSKLAATA